MRVKKFPQAHLSLTKNNKTLIIDPGYITFDKGFKVADFQGADVYLITHQHGDHLGPETIKEIVQDKPVYGNSDVVAKLSELGVRAIEIKDREKISVSDFEIEAVNLPHFPKEGVIMPLNTGFLIDGVFFHTGDGNIAPEISTDNLALIVGGASITNETALKFAKDVSAKLIIPIHYDVFSADLEEFSKKAQEENIEVRVLGYGEETEL